MIPMLLIRTSRQLSEERKAKCLSGRLYLLAKDVRPRLKNEVGAEENFGSSSRI
jgi:hypothetical protein